MGNPITARKTFPKGGRSIWFTKKCRAKQVTPTVDYTPLLNQIIKQGETILATINDQNTIVAKLITDGQLFIKDVTAKLVTLAANQTDPAVTAGINSTVADLTTLDAAFAAAEAALNPPPVTSVPTATP